MFSTCFEPKGSSSGRRLYVEVLTSVLNTLSHLKDCSYLWHVNKLYHTCTYNRLAKDKPSGSKHVQDIVKIKMLISKRCVVLVAPSPTISHIQVSLLVNAFCHSLIFNNSPAPSPFCLDKNNLH